MSKIAPFFIKQHDGQPYYPVTVKDSDGDVVDISGATIKCTMKNTRTESLHIDQQTSGCIITSGDLGAFEYRWQTGSNDTAVVGEYNIEFEITPGSGGKFTLPSKPSEVAKVFVVKSLDIT